MSLRQFDRSDYPAPIGICSAMPLAVSADGMWQQRIAPRADRLSSLAHTSPRSPRVDLPTALRAHSLLCPQSLAPTDVPSFLSFQIPCERNLDILAMGGAAAAAAYGAHKHGGHGDHMNT
ncbi:hypothetical protein ACOSQ2_021040 [Xanthoceras sorbifolium]